MSGDFHQDQDQERFEDYLELEQYIEQLQAGRVAHPPAELTPGRANIYRMAALFRSASPESGEPRPEFAAELQTRLEQELQQRPKVAPRALKPEKAQKKGLQVSRRALLTGGAAVAASLAAGAAPIRYLRSLPRLNTKVVSGNVYVEVPVGQGSPSTKTWQ